MGGLRGIRGVSEEPDQPPRIESKDDGATVFVSVIGELDLASTDRLNQALRDAQEREDDREIVVDLSELTFVDSSGLAVLLDAYKRNRAGNGPLHFIASKHDAVTRVLALTGLDETLG